MLRALVASQSALPSPQVSFPCGASIGEPDVAGIRALEYRSRDAGNGPVETYSYWPLHGASTPRLAARCSSIGSLKLPPNGADSNEP